MASVSSEEWNKQKQEEGRRRKGGKTYLDGEGVLDEEDACGEFVLLDLVHAARRQLLLDVRLHLRVSAFEWREGGREGEGGKKRKCPYSPSWTQE